MDRHLLDKTLAALALVVLSPALLLGAIGVWVSSPGPIVYRSRRVGRRGREFWLYKFRTMHPGADASSAITSSGDPRVFAVGRWLRFSKIDELPQLVNILRGEMAIVGPRPEDPRIVRDHFTRAQTETLDVLPGLASPGSLYNYTHGEALLAHGDAERRYVDEVLPTKLALDQVYVREASLLYDAKIVWRTLAIVGASMLGRRSFPPPAEMKRIPGPRLVAVQSFTGAGRTSVDIPEEMVKRVPPSVRRAAIVLVHLILVGLVNYAAFALRFDGNIPEREWRLLQDTLPWLIALRGLVFAPFQLYGGLWRYAGLWDLRNIAMAIAVSSVIFYVGVRWVAGVATYPRSIFIIDALLLLVAVGGIRLVTRLRRSRGRSKDEKRVLVYGAGDAGEMIVRDMKRHVQYVPVGFVDDDETKVGQRIHGVPVLGTRRDLTRIMEREQPHEVLVAVPHADSLTMRGLVEALRPFKVRLTTLPNLREVLDGPVHVHQIRTLSIEDLLSRAPVGLDMTRIRELIVGRRVMVTGAGGSIGSELCRQIAALSPASLILYERYENGLYAVANDLSEKIGFTAFQTAIGDVTDERRLSAVMAAHRPQIIFHAAAHKHVPLMELNVCEAIKNNVIGTRLVAEAADRFSVERVVLISSDKAVNPSSVMGATKRVAELMLQGLSQRKRCRYIAVRFGNVLGSNGSVVPRFLDQIKAGGPVTVTHPEIRRYFMMIPEAVQLVLQAAALGTGGELFVLDMGEQIPVVEMARNLIRLSGFIPEQDIQIEYTGLRPGEKLYEELAGGDELIETSSVEKILRVTPRAGVAPDLLAFQIAELEQAADRGDESAVMHHLRDVVRTFMPETPVGSLARTRRDTRRGPVMIRRRFTGRSSFEYVQVIADRREPSRPDRRAAARGGRRATDPLAPAIDIAMTSPEPAETGVGSALRRT